MQGTYEFSKTMGISQRTAAAWAQSGIVRAHKISGKWVIEKGEKERLEHEYWVQRFKGWGQDEDVAEILSHLMSFEPAERKKVREEIIKICQAAINGIDSDRFFDLIKHGRQHEIGLDALIAECMPSQA